MRDSTVRAAVVLATAALVAACAGDGEPEAAAPTTTRVPPVTATTAATTTTATTATTMPATTTAVTATRAVAGEPARPPRRASTLVTPTTAAATSPSPAPSGPPPSSPAPPPSSPPTTAPPGPPAPILLAAGDIASCASTGDEATAALLDRLDGQILTLGDHAYERGTAAEFSRCYAPTWGRHRGRTHPVVGNHDTYTSAGAPYAAYFDGVPRWYSWDHAGWHLVALDSTSPGNAAQLEWLRADLSAHAGVACTLAYWHHPRYSSGTHGSDASVAPLWDVLAGAGADVILQGHDHDYERLAPIDGLRSWVVGTGGRSHYRFTKAALPQTEARDDTSFGVLELTLRVSGYDWRFVAATGAFEDRGSEACR